MNHEYIGRFTDMVRKAQEPLQELAQLNVKTLQGFSYLKPDEVSVNKPEELFEKQIRLFVENGHKALDYLQKSFDIYERALLSFSKDTRNQTEEFRATAEKEVERHMSKKGRGRKSK